MENHPVWSEPQKKLEMLRRGTGISFGQPVPDTPGVTGFSFSMISGQGRQPAEEFGRQVIGWSTPASLAHLAQRTCL